MNSGLRDNACDFGTYQKSKSHCNLNLQFFGNLMFNNNPQHRNCLILYQIYEMYTTAGDKRWKYSQIWRDWGEETPWVWTLAQGRRTSRCNPRYQSAHWLLPVPEGSFYLHSLWTRQRHSETATETGDQTGCTKIQKQKGKQNETSNNCFTTEQIISNQILSLYQSRHLNITQWELHMESGNNFIRKWKFERQNFD